MEPATDNYTQPNPTSKLIAFSRKSPRLFYGLVILFGLILGSMIVRTILFAPNRTITVIGIGTQKIKAEKAVISFSLLFEAPTQSVAIAGGEQRFTALIRSLDQYSPLAIDKTTYQLTNRSSTRTATGQLSADTAIQYVNAARVTVKSDQDVAAITKALYEAGASVVSQPRFVPSDEAKTEIELRKAAIKNARDRAFAMALSTGSLLGRVITIQEGQSTGQTGSSITGGDIQTAGASAEEVTTVETNNGEIELQAAVTVVYSLW